jgi:WD40 repeat protein
VTQVKKVRELSGHAGPIYAFSEGRSAGRLLTGSGDRFVAEWDLAQGVASPFSVKMEDPVFAVHCMINTGILLIGTGNGNLHIIDLKAGKEVKNLKVHSKGIFSILPVPEEQMVIVAGGDGLLSVWSTEDWRLLRHFQVSANKLRHLMRDANHLYVCDSDGYMRVFDIPWLNELHQFEAHEGGCYHSVKHPTKPLIVSGGKDGHLRFWHTEENWREVRSIPAHNYGIYSIVFSPDKRFAASASRDKSIKIWHADTFEPAARLVRPQFPMHTHSINWLWWHPDGTLISGGDDRKIMLWSVLETQAQSSLS